MSRSMNRTQSFQQSRQKWELAKLDPHSGSSGISTWTFIFHVIHEGFVGNVPVEVLEKFPGMWSAVTFFITYAIFVGCYIGFFVWAFIDGSNSTFISLDANAGNCNPVSKPLTGIYLASSLGAWQGDANFLFSDAVLQFQFNELTTNKAGFQTLIATNFSLDTIANYTATQDVATNLLVWMHYRKAVVTENNKVQSMKLYSSPSDVFDRALVSGGAYISGVPGGSEICNAMYAEFDVTTATVTITLQNTTKCNPFLSNLSALALPDGDLFRAKIKLTSFTTATAINANVISMYQLETLGIITELDIEGHKFNITSMYDPNFQHANTFVCSDLNWTFPLRDFHREICFISLNNIVLLPILAHADEHCASCDDDPTLAEIPCDTMQLLPFYIFFPRLSASQLDQSFAFFDLFLRVSNAELKRAASRMYMHGDTTDFDALCPDCGILFVHLGDSINSISPYRRTITTGLHCVDSIPAKYINALADSSPATLNETYYKCRSSLVNNILNAVGLAFGNTSVFAVTFLALFLPFLFCCTKKFDPHRKLVKKYMGAPKLFEDIMHVDERGEVIVEKEKPTDTFRERRLKKILSSVNVDGLSSKMSFSSSGSSSRKGLVRREASQPVSLQPLADWGSMSAGAESQSDRQVIMLSPRTWQISDDLFLGLDEDGPDGLLRLNEEEGKIDSMV